MAIFHARSSFYITERQLFVLSGTVVKGPIHTGMLIRIQLGQAFWLAEAIHTIETVTTDGGDEIRLCIVADQEVGDLWQSMNIQDEPVDVVQACE